MRRNILIHSLVNLCAVFISSIVIAQSTAYDPSVFIDIDINSGNPTCPFPQFLEYSGGGKTLAKYNAEGVTHADMEKGLREAYEIMMHRCRYEGTYCGVKYISFNSDAVAGNYGTFVSEGDGYALLAAAIFADQKTFNGLYMWIHDIRFAGVNRFRDGQSRGTTANDYAGPYMAAWKDKTFDAAYGSDSHSATDGDVDIAMAMLIAYKQWGEWMMQDGQVVKDVNGNPISLKYETQRVVGALVDTIPQIDPGSHALTGYLCGVVGIDGYEKRGNSWGELTRWRFSDAANAAYPGVNGPYNGGPNLYSIYGGNYIDYDAPSYFEEFWRWLKNGDGVDDNNRDVAPWEIHQFKRAAASGNWLNKKAYEQGLYASIGNVSVGDDGSNPTFGVYVDGEDFRYAWRHILDYLWHGDADYDWDPVTHQVIEGTNNSERLMGIRHASLLESPSKSGEQICARMGASPDPGQPYWYGVSQIPQQWTPTGGITSAYHTNYSVGAGATAAVASENLPLIADIYRQCEIMWDDNTGNAKFDNPEQRYIGSTPKYFHGWFRTLGMLVCSGNLLAPETMVSAANMKVYMSVDKTYAYQGDKVGYMVQYRNYGSADATGVTIQTPLDEDYSFVSASDGGVYDASTHTITWNVGTVPGFKSGELAATMDSVSFTVKVTSLVNSRVCETSTISGTNFPDWISNEYPNHATYTMERNCVDVLANRSLVVDKSANRTELNPSDKVTFTVDFENVSSDDAWMNGGRDNVRISYGNYYMNDNAYQFYHLYRFWNDSYEAYINMNNYRVSYFMYDAAAQGLYDATTNPTGWTFVVDNQNDLDKYGYNPSTGPITFAYQKIPQGEDQYGKWNQRLMIRFADVLMAPSTHVYDKLDSQYLLHKGVWGPGFIRARLASNPASDLTTRVQDDWSFSTDVTEGSLDGQGTTFTLISPCWANYDNLGYEINNYSRHVCSPSSVGNYTRILVEEFDGYTWRRIQGSGPLPGKEAYNVTIVDTIPKELSFDAFVTNKALGIEATYTAAPTGSSYSGIVKWTIPEMLVGESGKLVYTCVANDIGCPSADDAYYVNAAWIYSDTDSPDSASVELMTTCAELPPFIEPQDALFKSASAETVSVGDEITYEVKFVNTVGTKVDEDCSSTANWMSHGSGSLPATTSGGLSLNTTGNGAYFFGPKYSYGVDGSVTLTFGGSPYSTQELYFVMRYVSGTPGQSNFKGICMKMFINKDGNNNYGYELYNNGTLVQKEGSSWADAIAFSGSSQSPVFKFVLNGDHLYMYINDAENDWTNVVKDWSGLTATAPGYFGLYVNSNGNGNAMISQFTSELDYAFDIAISDELPSELTNISNISGSGIYSAGTNKITWPTVLGPIGPNEEISYTFDATVHSCSKYINNIGVATVYGQDELRVVNTVKCGATVCPDAPEAEDVSLCKGEAATALRATGQNLLWYTSATGGTGTATLIPSTSDAGITDYYVTQTVGGCESDRTRVTVTVIETEKPEVNDVQLCLYTTNVSELSAVGTDLTWYTDSDVELTEAPTPDVTSEGTVSYFVTQTLDECESDKAEIIVTVSALPLPVVVPISYCQGETAEALTATADETLRWYETAAGGDAQTSITPSTSDAGTTSYYVSQYSESASCESERAELVVTVKTLPEATIDASASGYCGTTSTVKLSIDSDVDLTTATYQWSKDATETSTTATVLNAEAGEYTCTIDLDGCKYTTEAKTIVQSENPTYTISGGGTYCPESLTKDPILITFTAGTAPFTFVESVTGKHTVDGNSFTIENPEKGVYKLTSLVDAGSCSMSETATSVEVIDLATPDLSVSNIPSECEGTSSVDISQYVTADAGDITYTTDKGTITADGVLSGFTESGEYTVTVQLTGDVAPYCSNTKTATVTINANPVITIDPISVCSETDVVINPTVSGVTTYTSQWVGDGLNATGLNEPTFNATVAEEKEFELSLTVTDKTTLCSSQQSVYITVHPIPEVSLEADKQVFCISETEAQTITATVKPSSLTGTHTWTNVTSTTSTASFVPNEHNADTYTLSYQFESDAHCMSEIATIDMTVNVLPEITLSSNYKDVCISGENSNDIIITPSKTTGTIEYTINNGGIITSDGHISPSDNAADIYTVEAIYTDENSCQNTASTTVTVHALPDVSFSVSNPSQLCNTAEAVTLAVSPDVANALSYSFAGTVGSTSALFNPQTSAIGDNTVTYTYTDSYGCQNSATATIEVVQVPTPTIEDPNPRTVTIDEGGILLETTMMKAVISDSGDDLEWKNSSNVVVSTADTYESPETTEGNYTYTVREYRTINNEACYSEPVTASLVLSNCTAKSPVVSNHSVCVGDAEEISLSASFASTASDRKLSWFADKELTSLLQDNTETYNTTISTSVADEFTYYVAEYSSDKDCWSVPTPVTIIVHALPEIAISEIADICYYDIQYTASGLINGVQSTAGIWSIPDGGLNIDAHSGVIDAKSAGAVDGTYKVRYEYTDNNNCSNYAEREFSVIYPEKPSATSYLGIVSKPDPVVLSVESSSLEAGYTAVHWYESISSSIPVESGLSWTTSDDPSVEHTVTYYVTQEIDGCESEKASVDVQIVSCPFAKPDVTSVVVCKNDALVPDLSAQLPSTTTVPADVWKWYDKDKQEIASGSVSTYASQVSTAQVETIVFYVGYLATEPTTQEQCPSPLAEVTVTVNDLPSLSFDASNKNLVCYDGGDVQLTATPRGGTWTLNADNLGITTDGVLSPSFAGEITDTYTLAYTYEDPLTKCSQTITGTIDVQYTPAPVVTGHASLVSDNADVIISATVSDVSASVSWYSAGGALLSAENPFTTGDAGNVVTSKSYFATQTIRGCESEKSEAKVVIIDCPVPKPNVVQPDPICNYSEVPELQATRGAWADRPTEVIPTVFSFYDVETGGTPISGDIDGSFKPTIDVNQAGVYTFWVAEYNENVYPSACESKRSKITLEVKKTISPILSITTDNICQGTENPQVTAVGAGTVNWYEEEPSNPAGSGISGSSYRPTYTEVGDHTVWAVLYADGCYSEAVSVSYTIKPVPDAPTTIDARICESEERQSVCATANPGGAITWYATSDATGLLAKSECYSPTVSVAGEYTYYAVQTIDGCTGPSAPAVYTISPMPKQPVVVTDPSSCDYDGTHELSVAASEGVTIAWYKTSELSTLIQEGNTLTHTITEPGTQLYYVRQIQDGCVGLPTRASFIIVSSPENPIVTDDEVCYGTTALLSTNGSKDVWYADQNMATVVGTGYSLEVPDVTKSVSYYVVRERNGCQSDLVESHITVIAPPSVMLGVEGEESSVYRRCEYDEENYIEASVVPEKGSSDYIDWFIFPGNKTIHDADSILLSEYVNMSSLNTSSVAYTVRAQYMVKNETKDTYCPSPMDTIKVTTYAKARKPIVLSKTICQGDDIEPLFAFGTPALTWISLDGTSPVISQGQRYYFDKNQSDLPVGTYRYIVFDIDTASGCKSDTVLAEMTMAPAAQTGIFGNDEACVGSTMEYYTQFNETSTYMWTVTGGNLNYSKDATSLSVRYVDWKTPGIDTLVVFEQTWAGCLGFDTLVVKIADKPHARFAWSLPGSSNVIEFIDSTRQDSIMDITADGDVIAEEVPYTLFWNFGHAGEDANFVDLEVPYSDRRYPITESNYVYGYNCPVLTVENSYGCSDSYTECIYINTTSSLYVPDAFSPSNPAHEVRYFQPKGQNLKNCEVSVYDKWGNLVWYSDEVEDGSFIGRWDGRCNGKMMASDTYIWKMEATFIDGQKWEGFDVGNGKKAKYGNVLLVR